MRLHDKRETEHDRENSLFTTGELSHLLGVSIHEISYWVRSRLLRPSIRQANGQGSRRLFNLQDVKRATFIQRLREATWKPAQILRTLSFVEKIWDSPESLLTPMLIHEGKSLLILCREKSSHIALLDASSPGQYVMVIALNTLEEETRRRLTQGK